MAHHHQANDRKGKCTSRRGTCSISTPPHAEAQTVQHQPDGTRHKLCLRTWLQLNLTPPKVAEELHSMCPQHRTSARTSAETTRIPLPAVPPFVGLCRATNAGSLASAPPCGPPARRCPAGARRGGRGGRSWLHATRILLLLLLLLILLLLLLLLFMVVLTIMIATMVVVIIMIIMGIPVETRTRTRETGG